MLVALMLGSCLVPEVNPKPKKDVAAIQNAAVPTAGSASTIVTEHQGPAVERPPAPPSTHTDDDAQDLVAIESIGPVPPAEQVRDTAAERPAPRRSKRLVTRPPIEHGTLFLNTIPAARAYIDGSSTAIETPIRNYRLSEGRHVIQIETRDGRGQTVEVDIRKDLPTIHPGVNFDE